MTERREFPRKVRAAIVARAMNADGQIACEGCGLILGRKKWQIDHTLAEALVLDKSRPLTADDGKLLGQECCHAPKTADDIRQVRKSDRQRDRHTGAMPRSPRGFAKSPPQRRASAPLTKPLPPRRCP